jgi:hypothetical protein
MSRLSPLVRGFKPFRDEPVPLSGDGGAAPRQGREFRPPGSAGGSTSACDGDRRPPVPSSSGRPVKKVVKTACAIPCGLGISGLTGSMGAPATLRDISIDENRGGGFRAASEAASGRGSERSPAVTRAPSPTGFPSRLREGPTVPTRALPQQVSPRACARAQLCPLARSPNRFPLALARGLHPNRAGLPGTERRFPGQRRGFSETEPARACRTHLQKHEGRARRGAPSAFQTAGARLRTTCAGRSGTAARSPRS